MNLKDLGYDPKTGRHDRRLTRAESIFLGILWVDYVGRKNKISGNDLAQRFAYGMDFPAPLFSDGLEHWKRDVRYMQNHLLHDHDGIPILSQAGTAGGYYIAENDDETTEFHCTFRKRGLTGVIKASDGRKASVIEAVEQLAFEFEDLVDKTSPITKELKEMSEHIAPQIVDALLAKMTRDPEQFALNIKRLREKYFSGGVLLRKESLQAMKIKTKELQDMVSNLAAE